MRTRTFSLWALTLLAACQHSDPTEPELGTERQALGEESAAAADAEPACSVGDLGWDQQTNECSGPWEYERRNLCWQTLPAGHTGPADRSECTQWSNCERWCFGSPVTPWVPWIEAWTLYIPDTCTPQTCWVDARGLQHCNKPQCRPNIEGAQAACDEKTVPVRQQWASTVPSHAAHLVEARGTIAAMGNQNYDCRVEYRYPRPGAGMGSECGCTTTTRYDTVACEDLSTTGERVLSSAGLSLNQLSAEDADAFVGAGLNEPRCTSCEQLPLVTPADFRAKFACLCESWNRIPGVTSCSLQAAMFAAHEASEKKGGAASEGKEGKQKADADQGTDGNKSNDKEGFDKEGFDKEAEDARGSKLADKTKGDESVDEEDAKRSDKADPIADNVAGKGKGEKGAIDGDLSAGVDLDITPKGYADSFTGVVGDVSVGGAATDAKLIGVVNPDIIVPGTGTIAIDPGPAPPAPPVCSNNTTTYDLPERSDIVDERGAGSGALDASQVPALVRHFKLLLELGGHHLSGDARGFVHDLYEQYPSVAHDCGDTNAGPGDADAGTPSGLSFDIPSSCAATTRPELSRLLLRCEKLAAPHVSPETAVVEAASCIALLDSANELSASDDVDCNGAGIRLQARRHATVLLGKALKTLQVSPASPHAALPRQLHLLSEWWRSFSASHARDDIENLDPRLTLDEMIGRFWEHASEGHAVLTGLRSTLADAEENDDQAENEQAIEAALLGSEQTALALDKAVLQAATTSVSSLPAISDNGTIVLPQVPVQGAPLRGLPLLLFTTDALTRLHEKVDGLVELHDFACRFKSCAGAAFRSPVERLVALTAALASPQELLSELNATTSDLEGFRPVFAALSASHGTLRAALTEAGLTIDLTVWDGQGDVPTSVIKLARLVQTNRARMRSLRARGVFDQTDRRALHAGVDDLARERARARMTARLTQMSDAQRELRQHLDVLARGLIETAGADQARAAVRHQQTLTLDRFDRLRSDMAGLQVAGDAERARLGDMVHQLENLPLDQGQLLAVNDTHQFFLTGRDAQFENGLDRLISEYAAVSLAGETLAGARMVAVETRGQWSPTCSLREIDTLLPDPIDPGRMVPRRIDYSGALTGPEGFIITGSQSEAHTRSAGASWDQSHTSSSGSRYQECLNLEMDLSKFLPALDQLPIKIGLSTSDCNFEEETSSRRNSRNGGSQDTSDARTSASFASGLRLSNTPFPEAPVGSLLAVVVPRGATYLEQRTDLHVISGPHSTFMLPEESDVHFVVNDRACADADDLNDLEVVVRPITTVGTMAAGVVDQMAASLIALRARQREVALQGSVLPHQLQQLRSAAMLALESRLSLAFGALPGPLQNLFQAFLDLELLEIERRTQLRALERSAQQLRLELTGLSEELVHVDRRGRLSLLAPLWSLHALPQRHLKAQLDDLLTISQQYLLPMMDLWYPESVEQPSSQALALAVDTLLAANPNTRFADLVTQATTIVNDALMRFEDAEAWNRPYPVHTTVALSWDMPYGTGSPPVQKSPFRRATSLPAVELPEGAAAVDPQTAILGARTGLFHVTPEELYSRNGGTSGVLWCHEAVPVISRMALFVARPGGATEPLNAQRRWLSGRVSNVQFQTESELVPYSVNSATWQEFKIPVIFGAPGNALEDFYRLIANPSSVPAVGAAGMSPFADFAVDFQGLMEERLSPTTTAGRDGFTFLQGTGAAAERKFEASEIILVMKLDTRETSAPVAGVTRCLPATP